MRVEEARVDASSPEAYMRYEERRYALIDLRGPVRFAWKQRGKVLLGAVAGCALGIAAALLFQPKYDATARLLPPQPKTSGVALFATRNDGDVYLGFATSRTVADDVIAHQNLKSYFHSRTNSQARAALGAMSSIRVDKDQFITVTVRANEPETALRISNEYLNALYRMSESISVSEGKHRWEYFAGPLEEEKNRLSQAEEELKEAEQKTGMVLPEAQVRLGVNAQAQLKQEIADLTVQLAALRTGNTEENSQVVQVKSEIASLQAQLAGMRAETGGGPGGVKTAAQLPELTLQVERRTREVQFHQALFQILSRQYENARVDESYTPPIEVVDRAVLPEEKSWPPRKLFALFGLILGAAGGGLFSLAQAAQIPRRLRELTQDSEISGAK